ncbi:MAG: fatty acid desaturase [Acidimicrobiales bacterium]
MRALVTAALAGVAVAQLATFLTTVYLHRSLSHRALTLRPALAWVFRVVLWMTTGLRARQWVAVHRKHHAFTDVEGDPHSPRLLGWVRVQFANVGLYRKVANDPEQVARYARDLPADRWDRVLFDRAWLGLGIGIGLLVVVFGPWVGLAAAVIHTLGYLLLNAAVNAITHTFGRRPFDNTATNLRSLAWVTMGEGLHNNHHAVPTSARLSLARGEFDPAWPVIALFRRFGWLTVRIHRTKVLERTAPDGEREPAGVG